MMLERLFDHTSITLDLLVSKPPTKYIKRRRSFIYQAVMQLYLSVPLLKLRVKI